MKITLLPLICLVSSTIAAPINNAKRDLQAVDLAIQHVTAALTRLDAAFNNINTRTKNKEEQNNSVNEILNINNFLQSELRIGTGVVTRGGNIGPVEAVSLVTPIQKLTTLTTQVTEGWQGPVKKLISASGKRDTVLRELTATKKASNDFADSFTNKLPLAYQYIGTVNKATTSRSIQNAIDDYS